MRIGLSLLALIVLLALVGISSADPRTRATSSTGQVVVAASPVDVYAAMTCYAYWPYIFPEVKSVNVLYQQGSKAVVRVTTWTGTNQTLELSNDAQQRVIRFRERGRASVEAAIVFSAGATAQTTVATARYAGDPTRASADLESIRAYFAGMSAPNPRPSS